MKNENDSDQHRQQTAVITLTLLSLTWQNHEWRSYLTLPVRTRHTQHNSNLYETQPSPVVIKLDPLPRVSKKLEVSSTTVERVPRPRPCLMSAPVMPRDRAVKDRYGFGIALAESVFLYSQRVDWRILFPTYRQILPWSRAQSLSQIREHLKQAFQPQYEVKLMA